ncbi:MAG: O-methyltransferase [Burkholderiales bacterium]
MSQETWDAVDRYFTGTLVGEDAILAEALRDSERAGLPSIAVSAPQGRFLNLLARVQGARNILEIGTLGGYSAIWLARALPPGGGRLVTLEVDPRHAEVARANLARAGFANIAQVRLGRAIDALPELEREGAGPFDFVFIDADKPSNPEYFAWALKLSRRGTVIVVDNVVRGGAVADAASQDAAVLGVRRLAAMIAAERRVSATVLQTVGTKGYDGFAIALVVS